MVATSSSGAHDSVRDLLLRFPDPARDDAHSDGDPPLATVGGKGRSLIRMAATGLPVPPGVILSTAFFDPWLAALAATDTWSILTSSPETEWPTHAAALQARVPSLTLTTAQTRALDALRRSLDRTDTGSERASLFAVRSSSPDEDLIGASFAGGYETSLGVRIDELEVAIRRSFASCLDARVMTYKRVRGLPVFAPRIAVVVQQQIDSEVAGVAFSLNPLSNDHDEAVVDANFGLGESVVAGLVNPDHFVVDKVARGVIERTIGDKRTSIWLDAEGGTETRSHAPSSSASLDDTRLLDIVDLLCRIEDAEGHPVDIEWTIADERLYLLQARPITAFVPLPPSMMTPSGGRRRLYADIALAGGFAINAPISRLGLDFMAEQLGMMANHALGDLDLDLTDDQRLWFFAGNRMYQDLSNLFWLASPARMAKSSESSDVLVAAILREVDADRYKAAVRPPWARLRMLIRLPRALWRLRGTFGTLLAALLTPKRALRRSRARCAAFEDQMRRAEVDIRPFAAFRRAYGHRIIEQILQVDMPILAAGLLGVAALERLAKRPLADDPGTRTNLCRGFEGNLIVEMGMDAYRLATVLDAEGHEAEGIDAWNAYLDRFGHRGPLEMDLASPRYGDDVEVALDPILAMPIDDPSLDPARAHARQVAARRRAVVLLIERSGWLRRHAITYFDGLAARFAGSRETPKHHNLLFYAAVRRRALAEGRRLVAAGRLDRAEHVFDLTFAELEPAARDSDLDLRDRSARRRRQRERLGHQVKAFPAVIDSRGRILRPPAAEASDAPDTLVGMAISPGVVRGPVKILHHPREKPVNQGDILVAYTTDPGWTPLFANAAAVVLEVGGVLQHGAVVAREYGKPCVGGIDRLLERLEDGEIVDVDGSAGTVRRIND